MPFPVDLRSSILSLSNFVDKQSVAFLAKPEAHLLNALISINRELSSGLSSDGEPSSVEVQRRRIQKKRLVLDVMIFKPESEKPTVEEG